MELYTIATSSNDTPNLLSQSELEILNSRIATNADRWLGRMVQKNKDSSRPEKSLQQKSTRGRSPKVISNPFYDVIGGGTYLSEYPAFAMDIIEGIARLDWHDRPIGAGGKSMPLSVRSIVEILEWLPIVTNDAVKALLGLDERHARRYVKAIEFIVPHMMKSRPMSLCNEMEGIAPNSSPSAWQDSEELIAPNPEALAKLHFDLRTLTKFKSAEAYEVECEPAPADAHFSNVIAFPPRMQHPKKVEALVLLEQGLSLRAIAKELGISVNTVRSWQKLSPAERQAA
ncbi:helix-turn-helix domain-containing protein [Pseudomonas umsongensis]|uniref:helix-turn-helix domain-containing protein n=1 Tax=Pseudomonas umsongensis TaxID=198618 RepID=UPI003D7F4DDA